jgi:hypothetical protein
MIDHTARAFDTDLGQVAGKSKKWAASTSYIVQGRSPLEGASKGTHHQQERPVAVWRDMPGQAAPLAERLSFRMRCHSMAGLGQELLSKMNDRGRQSVDTCQLHQTQ